MRVLSNQLHWATMMGFCSARAERSKLRGHLENTKDSQMDLKGLSRGKTEEMESSQKPWKTKEKEI